MGILDLTNAIAGDVDRDKRKRAELAFSFADAIDSNPDEEAEKIRLQRKTGVPASLMDQPVMADAKRQAALSQVEGIGPALSAFLGNAENAKIAHDDVAGLQQVATAASLGPAEWAAAQREGLAGFKAARKEPISTLSIASESDKAVSLKRNKDIVANFVGGAVAAPDKAMAGLAEKGAMIADFVDWFLAAFPDETGMRRRVADIARESQKFWNARASAYTKPVVPRSAEYYAQQVGGSIGASLLAAPFGLGSANATAAMFGLFSEGGYDKMREAGTAQPMAAALSASNSSMEGLTELFSIGGLFETGKPLLRKAAEFLLKEQGGEMVNTLFNSLVDKVTTAPNLDSDELMARLIDTAIVTSIAGPVQGVTMHGVGKASEKLYSDHAARQVARQNSDYLTALGEGATATKTFERLPDKMKELVKLAKADGPVQDVYVDVGQFTQLFQSMGVDPAVMADQILTDPRRYHEAVATGSDIAIPLEDFATLAKEPFFNELVKDSRLNQTDMSAREIEQMDADRDQYINDLLALAQTSETEDADTAQQSTYQRFYDDAFGQLVGMGRPVALAEQEAALRARVFATLEKSHGISADELAAMFPLTIGRGNLDPALSKPVSFADQQQAAQFDELLDSIRSVKRPSGTEMYGPSLVDFLREKGISDDRGDLRSMDIDKGVKFKKKVLRDTGLAIDKAREAAVEAGYLPEGSTIADMLDAVDKELRGSPVYAPQNINEPAAERARSIDELAQYLDRAGLDISSMTNEEVRRTLDQMQKSGSENPNILFQSAHIETDNFKKWSNNAPLVKSSEADNHEFRSGEKVVVEGFHGTARPDRVGTRFQKKRATSGPMAFFTAHPDIASGYAQGKADTSLAYEETDYPQWFKYKPKGSRSTVDIVRAWYFLTPEQKQTIFDRMGDIREDDNGNIVYEKGGGDIGSYDWNLKQTQRGYDRRGNPLAAAVETWLMSGQIFNEEERFLEVLELAGFPVEDVKLDSPHAVYPFIYKVYITMQSPLVTSDVPESVVQALDAAAKKDRSRAKHGNADIWDKSNQTLREWVEEFHSPDNEHVWTSIPDKVTDVFRSLGYDGIIDVGGKGGGQSHRVYIPFDEHQVKSAIGNKGTYDVNKSNILLQSGNPEIKRGFIRFGEGIPGFQIGLLKDANASTVIHELGHYYLEVIRTLAATGKYDKLAQDYAIILDWLGAKPGESLTTEQHEQFARGFEAYLYEGKAPSEEVRGTFQRFKVWLKGVYKSIQSLGVELTDDVRGVFDRLMATEAEIGAASMRQNAKAMFATAQDAKMSEATFAAYQALAQQAHAAEVDRLDRIKLAEHRRYTQAWWKEARAKMREEVEAEAKANPVYEAVNFLYTGKLFDGSVFAGGDFKLSKADLVRMFDEATVKAIKKKMGYIYRKEGGLSPDLVAEMFGLSSGHELITKMMEAPKLREYVEAETDRRMQKEHGTISTADLEDLAVDVLHGDDRAKLLREELKAINRKRREVAPFVQAAEQEGRTALEQEQAEREYERRWMEAEKALAVAIEKGKGAEEVRKLKEAAKQAKAQAKAERKLWRESVPPVEFFREAAARVIAAKTVSELKPGAYSRAEAKAAKEAEKANGEGKYEQAAKAKERQILNHWLYREAVKAKEDADKIADYMRKLESGRSQQMLGKAGQEYLDQVNALLDRYEFRRVPLGRLGERERLLAWMERKEAETGVMPDVPPSVLNDALTVNYKTLTVAELRDVRDAAGVIVHWARQEGKIKAGERKREIMELADEAKASIEDNAKKGKIPRKPEKDLPQDRPARAIGSFIASHRKIASLCRQMDGGKDGGIMWNLVARRLNEAGDREATMRAEAAEKLAEIFGVYSAVEKTKMHMRESIPDANTSLSKWGRIVVALNMGNEGNLQRLGNTYTPEQVAAIVDGLDERDWTFVQSVLDFIGSYWPEIEAKEKRVQGVGPEKVIATPIVTKYGILPGGYFPITADREEVAKAGPEKEAETLKQMMGGGFGRTTTARGHVEARLAATGRPLDLTIDTVFRHVNQVIHDLTHHEALVDINRMMNTPQLQESIRDYYGMETYRQLMAGIRDVAIGDTPAQNGFDRFLEYTRVGVSVAGLGYNVVTSLMQPLGLTQSIVRIGPQWVGKGIGRWIGSPERMIETADWIYSQSEFMRNRGKTQNREVAEVRNRLTVGVIPHDVRDSFFYLIQQMQKTVDIPTWLGQYEKSMAEHGNEKDAIAEADQAVIDSQAGGQIKDLAAIQRGGPLRKMFTTFYSFFSTTFNLAAESKAQTDFAKPGEFGRFVVDMLMLYTVPVVLTVAIKEAIRRAIGGDDDDELLKTLAKEQLGYVMNGFIGLRELSSIFSGFQGYEGPAGTRIFSETAKLAKEIAQGEADKGLFKRLNSVGGILFHYPSTQVQRTVEGIIEIVEGRGNLLHLFFGAPKKR